MFTRGTAAETGSRTERGTEHRRGCEFRHAIVDTSRCDSSEAPAYHGVLSRLLTTLSRRSSADSGIVDHAGHRAGPREIVEVVAGAFSNCSPGVVQAEEVHLVECQHDMADAEPRRQERAAGDCSSRPCQGVNQHDRRLRCRCPVTMLRVLLNVLPGCRRDEFALAWRGEIPGTETSIGEHCSRSASQAVANQRPGRGNHAELLGGALDHEPGLSMTALES